MKTSLTYSSVTKCVDTFLPIMSHLGASMLIYYEYPRLLTFLASLGFTVDTV